MGLMNLMNPMNPGVGVKIKFVKLLKVLQIKYGTPKRGGLRFIKVHAFINRGVCWSSGLLVSWSEGRKGRKVRIVMGVL